MKILYAANKGFDSYFQLERFLKHSEACPYEVRVAGFSNWLFDITADYNLDFLSSVHGNERAKDLKHKNFTRYLEEIKAYSPDLIISDYELHTSKAAVKLNIPYWIVSSMASYMSLPLKLKSKLGVVQKYRHLFSNSQTKAYEYQADNAVHRFAYSFLGDLENPPELNGDFHFVRPYYESSDRIQEPNFVAALSKTDKAFISYFQSLGTKVYSETYEGFHSFKSDYAENLKNSYLLFSRGETSFIADAYYNNKYSLVYPILDKEHLINTSLIEYFKIGERIVSRKDYKQFNLLSQKNINFKTIIRPEIKYLHEYIMDF